MVNAISIEVKLQSFWHNPLGRPVEEVIQAELEDLYQALEEYNILEVSIKSFDKTKTYIPKGDL
jgi:hypothetical protein